MSDHPYGPSPAARARARDAETMQRDRDAAERGAVRAHDPAQGRDASVNLGWVLHELEAWALADFGPNGPTPAEYVERRFREWGA